jgi:hypothetical protein
MLLWLRKGVLQGGVALEQQTMLQETCRKVKRHDGTLWQM